MWDLRLVKDNCPNWTDFFFMILENFRFLGNPVPRGSPVQPSFPSHPGRQLLASGILKAVERSKRSPVSVETHVRSETVDTVRNVFSDTEVT